MTSAPLLAHCLTTGHRGLLGYSARPLADLRVLPDRIDLTFGVTLHR